MNSHTTKSRARRHYGSIIAAIREARRRRDELAARALSAGAEVPRR